MNPEVLFEDDDIIVCYKPANVAVETKHSIQEDMVTIIRNHRANKGEDLYVGIIQRLDQPVEGVLVFGKNEESAAILSRQLREHTIDKEYYAIISREQFPDVGELEDYMVKDMRNNTSKVVPPSDPRAKRAFLSYKTVATWDDKKLLDIKLETGRHHQIRVQLASRTAPILGDVKYGGQSTGRPLALCAKRLAFDHPRTGERMEFNITPRGIDFLECNMFKNAL